MIFFFLIHKEPSDNTVISSCASKKKKMYMSPTIIGDALPWSDFSKCFSLFTPLE